MDERRLSYFLAVVDEGGVTRAARTLHVAQPSLSQAIRALEQELGAELLVRAGRGVALSAAGEAFVGPARIALRAIGEARDAVGGVAALISGTLDIAALPTLAVDPLAPLIGAFRERYPGIAVRVHEPTAADTVRSLVVGGRCELGAAHLPLTGDDLEAAPLGEQELVFVFPPGSGGPGPPLTAAQVAGTPFVVGPPGTSARTLLEDALESAGVTPQIAVQTDSREAIVPLVLAGAGAALLPAPLAHDAERRGAAVRRARPAITRQVGLVHRRGPLPPAAAAFLASAVPRRSPRAGATPRQGT
jgi:DNA-binding transcriptional LysR family regulator